MLLSLLSPLPIRLRPLPMPLLMLPAPLLTLLPRRRLKVLRLLKPHRPLKVRLLRRRSSKIVAA
jgi:hypothetical protein